jgi:hypothetical protein
MPGTPSVRQDVATTDIDASRQTHTTCPPEEVRDESWGQTEMDVDVDVTPNDDAQRVATGNQQLTTPLLDISRQNNQALSFDNQQVKKMDIDEESPAVERLSPDSMEEKQEVKSGTQQSLGISNYMGSSLSMDYEFSNVRVGFICLAVMETSADVYALAAEAILTILLPAIWEQVPWHTAV